MGAKYIGTEVGLVRIDDKPVKPGDVIDGPPDVVSKLLARADFIATDMIAELEAEKADKKPKRLNRGRE